MKTAEQWTEASNDPKHWLSSNRFDKSFIKKIQENALRHAWHICDANKENYGAACNDISKEIERL